MQTLWVALACVAWLGCGRASHSDAASGRYADPSILRQLHAGRAPQPLQLEPSVVPSTRQPPALQADSRPLAFLPLGAQCATGYERFADSCVHTGYMRRTPVTQLMNELVAYQGGKPAPLVEAESKSATTAATEGNGASAGPGASSANTATHDDPAKLDPGALVATPEQIAERERRAQEAARNRGELDSPSSDDGAGETARSAELRRRYRNPSEPWFTEEEGRDMEGLYQRMKDGQVTQQDCETARKNVDEFRNNDCYMPPEEHTLCEQELPNFDKFVAGLCAMAQ